MARTIPSADPGAHPPRYPAVAAITNATPLRKLCLYRLTIYLSVNVTFVACGYDISSNDMFGFTFMLRCVRTTTESFRHAEMTCLAGEREMTASRKIAAPSHRRLSESNMASSLSARAGAVQAPKYQLVSSTTVKVAADDRPIDKLSRRALNVLKLLAFEGTGEIPPRTDWSPTNTFLETVTMKRLLTARNCGSQTMDEIINWLASLGVAIQPLHHRGKSLPAMWQHIEERFAAGTLTGSEMKEALERSVRRKNVRIPIGIQGILLQLLAAAPDQGSAGL